MEKKLRSTPLVNDRLSFLWLGIAAVLLVFTYGMYRNALGGMLAYVFLIRFLRSRRVGAGYLLTQAVLIVANVIAWWNTAMDLPPVGRVIFGLVAGLLYSIPLLLDRVMVRRFRGFASSLIFPVVITAFEFLTIWPNPFSTYGSLAYSLSGSPFLSQITSITGLWGVTFLISWFASTINWIWEEGVGWLRIRRGLVIYASVMFAVLLFGVVRLNYFLPQTGTVRIHGVVETDYTREEWNTRIEPLSVSDPQQFQAITQSIFEDYLQATLREAQAGAQIVVWPELSIEGFKEDVSAVIERAREIARNEGIYLVFTAGIVPPSDPVRPYLDENSLKIIDPQGKIVVDQIKYGCGSTRLYGFDIQTVDTPYGKLAGVICCDLDYPFVIRQVSQKGVDILLVPAFEPTRENLISHTQMVPFRTIENGVSIFRSTIQGISLAIDPFGRVLGSMNAVAASDRVLVAQLPNQHIFTVYSAVGELFGWLTVAGLVVIVAMVIIRGRKTKVEEPIDAAN